MITHFARCLQNVECEFCEFEVTDGPLTGNFVARNNLILKTKSNAIDANVTMISRVNSTTEARIPSRPVVDITTTTGSLYANFTLIAVDAGTEERLLVGGAYEITTRSRQASVRLEVVDDPVDSALKLFSKNMRGLLEVWLHPTYQGRLLSESLTGSISQRLYMERIRLEVTGRVAFFGTDGASFPVSNMSCLEKCGGEISPSIHSRTTAGRTI